MSRHLSRTAFAVAATIAFAGAAQAQATCGATAAANASCAPAGTQVSTTVQKIVFISITNPSVALTAPTDADFTGGGTTTKVDAAAQVATIRTNAPWTLTVQGGTWTGSGNNSKAVGDLGWTITGGPGYTAMTTSAVSVTTGAATAATTVTIGYRTAWSLTTDTPGTYTMGLTYTIAAP